MDKFQTLKFNDLRLLLSDDIYKSAYLLLVTSMKKLLPSFTLCTAFALSACTNPVVKDQNSYLYSVPVGSTLRLNKAISIPANLARRYFQAGKAVRKSDINIYYPHCSLLVNTLLEVERTIQPTVFEIYRVQDEEELAQRYVQYASTFFAWDGPTIVGYASYYYLHSADAPDVRSLECIQWNDPVDVEYLSINEVKKSLGDYFTLELKN